MTKNQYNPDSISPLFDSIQETMDERGVDIFQLSILSGVEEEALCGAKHNGEKLENKDLDKISVILDIPKPFLRNRQDRIIEFYRDKDKEQ